MQNLNLTLKENCYALSVLSEQSRL